MDWKEVLCILAEDVSLFCVWIFLKYLPAGLAFSFFRVLILRQ
jgi:hypothetical protein